MNFSGTKCKFRFGGGWLIEAALPPPESLPHGIPQIPAGTLLSIDAGISRPGPRGQYQACQHVLPNLGFQVCFTQPISTQILLIFLFLSFIHCLF